MLSPRPLFAALALAGLSLPAVTAHAAQSYDNCTGFIDSLPATITTSGTWCLRKDLATAMTSGGAVQVAANNVTIDCNDFKIGGLAAGNRSTAAGIRAYGRENVTVRNCALRGFYIGIDVGDGNGHLVEDNRVDNSLNTGISVDSASPGSIIRRNRVIDTGGAVNHQSAKGIYSSGDVFDNTVDGLFADTQTPHLVGIYINQPNAVVSRNVIRGLAPGPDGQAVGIDAMWRGTSISDNRVLGDLHVPGTGIQGHEEAFCSGNFVQGFPDAISICRDAGGNADDIE